MASFNRENDGEVNGLSNLLRTSLGLGSSSASASADQDTGLSLLDQLKRFQEQQTADFHKKCEDVDAQRRALDTPVQNRFDYNKVDPKIRQHAQSLPIYGRREELVKLIKHNQVVILMGSTGSGKSTQLPQLLVGAGFCDDGKGIIGITQPRRVAARALAERVAKEGGVKLGTLVGYAVRFDKCLSGASLVKFMTDGILVKECTQDPNLMAYSVIVIDEAHERSIHTDVCLGLLKRAAKNRPDLKIIISSATLDYEEFSRYFNNAPLFQVEGKMHHVKVIYNQYPVPSSVDAAVSTICNIHGSEEDGDILVFLSGQDEIELTWEKLEERCRLYPKEMLIFPCYGALPLEEQQRIFEKTPPNCRKVVLATNIAETSLTIEGIVFVIDSGYFKQNHYDPRTKIDTLVRKPITEFQAIQRKGRAGRTRPGKCYRLYTKSEFQRFLPSPEPDITRSNVESVVLDLMAMGIENPLAFEYMDRPPGDALMIAIDNLTELSALDAQVKLTPLGYKMASFPLEPPLSRVLIESANLQCSKEVIKIVAMLSTQHQNLFYKGKKVRTKADQMRVKFNQPEGDYLTLLKIYDAWVLNGCNQSWCRQHYMQHKILEEAEEIRIQLLEIFNSHRYSLSNSRSDDPLVKINVRKAFTAGYFRQVAKKAAIGYAYQAIAGNGSHKEVFLHPTSALFPVKPAHPWLIFHEVMVTTKAYMRGAISIEPAWIKEYSPPFAEKLNKHHGIIL